MSEYFAIGLRMRLKRFPFVHKPLRWLNRAAAPTLRDWIFQVLRRVFPEKSYFGPVRGFFSDYELLKRRSPEIPGEIILEDQGNPRVPAHSIMLLCKRTQHLQQPWPIFWAHHKNVRLIGPGLAHVNRQKLLSLDAVYGIENLNEDPAWHFFARSAPVKLSGSWTSVISRWMPTEGKNWYAHWLLDCLPRLALLSNFPSDTRILVPPGKYHFQEQSLRMLGVWERCRPTTEQHLFVEDYYFSSPPSMIVCYSPYAISYLRTTFLPLVAKGGNTPKRFFIRRTSRGRNMLNEQDVLNFFEKLGWTVVDTAELNFAEQIQWFANAEAIFAIHGSGTANMAWCSSGCKFVEMFAADYLAGDQEWIAQCVDVDYHFMVFPCDYKLDAMIDLAEVQRKLRELQLT